MPLGCHVGACGELDPDQCADAQGPCPPLQNPDRAWHNSSVTALSQRPPPAQHEGGLADRAQTCLTVTRFLHANELAGDLEATEARTAHLLDELDSLGQERGERQVQRLEDALLELDAKVTEPLLLAALAGTKEAQRRAYVRLLATRPITSHRRLERFLRLCRRMGERRDSPFKPGEALAGLPLPTTDDEAEQAAARIADLRARLRKVSAREFFEDDLYLTLRRERLALAGHVGHPKVLTAMLRFEAELQARIDGWTRELHGSEALNGRSPKEYIAASLRRQEKKLRRELGEEDEGERRRGSPDPAARRPQQATRKDSLFEQLDAMDAEHEGPTAEPSALDRLRNWMDDNAQLSLIASLVVMVLALGGLALSLSDPVDEASWDASAARAISPLLEGGDQRGTHFEGTLDAEAWAALDAKGRAAAADELRLGLKERGVFTAELKVEGSDEPAIVIEFARVTSIAQ